MRALTVRQPYADAIASIDDRAKRIENRTKPLPVKCIGVPVLLHAGKEPHASGITTIDLAQVTGVRTHTWPGTRSAILAVIRFGGFHLSEGHWCCRPWGQVPTRVTPRGVALADRRRPAPRRTRARYRGARLLDRARRRPRRRPAADRPREDQRMTDKPCDRCNGTAIDPEHSGVENYGDGIVRPVPEPCNACQTPRHCSSCGHPWDSHDTNADGNRSCRSVGHPGGVSCTDCRAMLTTEYRQQLQDERDADWFQAVWGAYTVILADARDAFGTSADAFFSDIHQSALASALLTYRKQMNALENTEPTA